MTTEQAKPRKIPAVADTNEVQIVLQGALTWAETPGASREFIACVAPRTMS